MNRSGQNKRYGVGSVNMSGFPDSILCQVHRQAGVYALLQEYDHKNAFQEAAKEISLAASLGLNSVRLFLPFELWRQQHDKFYEKSGGVYFTAGFLSYDNHAGFIQ